MKQTINKKVYNTETATLMHEWDNGYYGSDYRTCREVLYRTGRGQCFVAGYGGPASKYREYHGKSTSEGSRIELYTQNEAIDWLETHNGEEALEKFFSDELEEG